jgi:hypothetical protein
MQRTPVTAGGVAMPSTNHVSDEEMSTIRNKCANDPTEYVIDGSDDCEHPVSERSYLGNMGVNAMYQCEICGGVVVITQ